MSTRMSTNFDVWFESFGKVAGARQKPVLEQAYLLGLHDAESMQKKEREYENNAIEYWRNEARRLWEELQKEKISSCKTVSVRHASDNRYPDFCRIGLCMWTHRSWRADNYRRRGWGVVGYVKVEEW